MPDAHQFQLTWERSDAQPMPLRALKSLESIKKRSHPHLLRRWTLVFPCEPWGLVDAAREIPSHQPPARCLYGLREKFVKLPLQHTETDVQDAVTLTMSRSQPSQPLARVPNVLPPLVDESGQLRQFLPRLTRLTQQLAA